MAIVHFHRHSEKFTKLKIYKCKNSPPVISIFSFVLFTMASAISRVMSPDFSVISIVPILMTLLTASNEKSVISNSKLSVHYFTGSYSKDFVNLKFAAFSSNSIATGNSSCCWQINANLTCGKTLTWYCNLSVVRLTCNLPIVGLSLLCRL